MTFKIGERVRLKTGGPDMIVIGAAPRNGEVICEWFETGVHHERGFLAADVETSNSSTQGRIVASEDDHDVEVRSASDGRGNL